LTGGAADVLLILLSQMPRYEQKHITFDIAPPTVTGKCLDSCAQWLRLSFFRVDCGFFQREGVASSLGPVVRSADCLSRNAEAARD
jgi:hypothetical protein